MKRLAGHIYAVVGLLLVIVFAALSSIPITPFAVLPRGRRERYAIWGARWFAWMCLVPILWARMEVVGRENLPKKSGFLVVSNHRSWCDVAMLILWTASQGISKKEVAWIPFFGLNGYLSGAIFFDRERRTERGKVPGETLKLLGGGANVHLFPEGTRSRDGRMRQKVHLMLARLCWENGFDVVPACTWGTENALPVGRFLAFPGQQMGLEIGAPLDRAAFADGDAYAEATWAKVKAMAAARGSDQPFVSEAARLAQSS
ncbi:MAG: lysophospholipid acyltransferase family protein [Myxococcota bacterium]